MDRRSGEERRLTGGNLPTGVDRRSHKERRNGLERRKHRRFLAKAPAFVTLWSEHSEDYIENSGQILDISQGGISLRCTAKPEESHDYSLLEVFLSDYDYSIDKISFKLVSDIGMTSDSASSELSLRRYGIQFEQLTPEQKAKLDHFLLNHTIGKV